MTHTSSYPSRLDNTPPHEVSERVHHELRPCFWGDRKSLHGTPGQQRFHVHLDFDGTNPLRFKVLNFLFPFHKQGFVRDGKRFCVF